MNASAAREAKRIALSASCGHASGLATCISFAGGTTRPVNAPASTGSGGLPAALPTAYMITEQE